MTKIEARAALAGTWRFERGENLIALREIDLISAVYAHETTHAANPTEALSCDDTHAQRAS